ncbi:MAG: hypothetical protein R2762_17385 [Bryobacteraceae bacterium]
MSLSIRLAALSLCATLALAADITGKWDFEVVLDIGSGNPTFTFTQDGERLTGTYSGAAGDAKLTGVVKGDQVEFTFPANLGGDSLEVIYKGKIAVDGTMSGTADYGGAATGKWTAKRHP